MMIREFDCVECGQHIIRFGGREGEPALCGTCLHIPGWHKDPELRRRFAREPECICHWQPLYEIDKPIKIVEPDCPIHGKTPEKTD